MFSQKVAVFFTENFKKAMLSGKKRNLKNLNESESSEPPSKKAKIDNNNKLCEVWPKEQKNLSNKQISNLPNIISPNLHKAVFESFWNKRKFGAPIIEFYEHKNKTNPKLKTFQCVLSLINKSNKSQIINVKSSKFDSKKKSQIDVYQKFNYKYIPYKILLIKLKPYSFKNNLNLQQIVTRKGDHLKNKTNTIIIEPLPLSTNEVDIKFKLIKGNKENMIKFIEFERDSNKSIFKRCFIQFLNESLATKFVESLNNKKYQKHKLSVNFVKDRDGNYIKSFTKKSKYLKVVGFPNDIKKNKILQYLYQHMIGPKNSNLIFKYSIIAQVFLKFDSIKDCVEAYQILNKSKYDGHKENDKKKGKKYQLFARYSNEDEYNQSVEYRQNIRKIEGMFILIKYL